MPYDNFFDDTFLEMSFFSLILDGLLIINVDNAIGGIVLIAKGNFSWSKAISIYSSKNSTLRNVSSLGRIYNFIPTYSLLGR